MITADRPPVRSFRKAARLSTGFVLVLWAMLYCDRVFHLAMIRLGVEPRELGGLVGIFTAPLIHGSALHLIANSAPLLVIGSAMIYGYPRATRIALPAIWLLSGLGVWLFGRPAFHIGASGLVHGILAFVLVAGLIRRDRPAMALAMAMTLLYGGLLWGVLPMDPKVSWESHLAGAITGAICARVLIGLDPWPQRPRYTWEDDPEADDPVIGDLWREDRE